MIARAITKASPRAPFNFAVIGCTSRSNSTRAGVKAANFKGCASGFRAYPPREEGGYARKSDAHPTSSIFQACFNPSSVFVDLEPGSRESGHRYALFNELSKLRK